MTGHQQAQQLKRPTGQAPRSNHSEKQSSPSDQERSTQPNHVDVDKLAQIKVEEIELLFKDSPDQCLRSSTFANWFSILKQIITAADLHRTNDNYNNACDEVKDQKRDSSDIYADFTDDNEQFNAHVDLTEQFATNNVKWTIRVRAFKIVHKLVEFVISAMSQISGPTSSAPPTRALDKVLPDLVRLSFVAATSPFDELKMQGFEMFRVLIESFATHEEKEFPGHSILEQYKTQVLSAVKPAFNLDAPPYITAIASQICSLWICKGLEKNPSDIKRTYELMLLSIEKLDGQGTNQHSKLYTESELEQERIDILSSWALLYIAAKEPNINIPHGKLANLSIPESNNLYILVESQLAKLVDRWWEALKDYALLIMPSPKILGTSHDHENVYTREVALRLFSVKWPKLMLAVAIWLCDKDIPKCDIHHESVYDCDNGAQRSPKKKVETIKYCKFLCGLMMKELSRCIVEQSKTQNLPYQTVMTAKCLHLLLSSNQCQQVFCCDLGIGQEFYRMLYQITATDASEVKDSMLTDTLHLMYEVIVKQISDRRTDVHYGLAKTISSIMSSMKSIDLGHREKSTRSIEINRSHLALKIQNLITLIKIAPAFVIDEAPLQVATIAVFQEVIRFEQDSNIAVIIYDNLPDLCSLFEGQNLIHFVDELLPDLGRRFQELMVPLFDSEKYCSADRSRLAKADIIAKAMRLMIDKLSPADRPRMIEKYTFSVLHEINVPTDEQEFISGEAKKKRDLIEFCLAQISFMKRSQPETFEVDMRPETKRKLDQLIKIQRDTKARLESNIKKVQLSKSARPSKPSVSKIALKADFSNFYAKET